ncbi:glycosyltransferase [Actinokineospora enzanensis]|uniref:glycosyltransferase n=1 Tax=Actinokineospora enzanensis TaxID=155975 RepID=UPI0003682A11|nr:glycosyltransferase [Actinokineospora enzanensis]
MKVVVTCQPATGHFHAVAPLAIAARDAGHDVVVATGRGLAPWVRRSGLEVVELGPDWLAEGPRTDQFDDQRRRLRLMAVATAALIPGIVETVRERDADVVLHESLEWAGPLAADSAGVPFAALGQLPRLPRAVTAEVMSGAWTAARTRLGLDPDPGMHRLYPYLYLDSYIPSMQPLSDNPLAWFGGDRSGDVDHLVMPPLYQVPAAVPDWLTAPRTRPLVYMTMGTAFNEFPHLFRALADGLRDEDVDVVMTVGSGVDVDAVGIDAPNVRVVDYVPQEEILSRTDVLVQHSGYLTTVGALRHGVPMVVVPVAVDQPYHAHRLAAAGVAIRLSEAEATATRLRESVRAVLDDDLYRRNAARLQAELHAMPPVERGIELLERLAATGKPVLRDDA